MALVHPRGMILIVPRDNTLNVTIPTILKSNSTSQPLDLTAEKSSWFSRVLNHVPGYKWLKNKVGRFFRGPTYGMTATQLKDYRTLQARENRIADLKEERLAEFKVAKFMVLEHPEFYWYKYVSQFGEGSEERKRAVFLFALTNKEMYGNYYGPTSNWGSKNRLNDEFKEMGINLERQNIVKEYTERGNETDVVRLRSRDLRLEAILIIPDADKKMYERMMRIVEATEISITRNQTPHNSVSRGTRRPFKMSDQEISTQANFD
jgi:hypothetical protein